MPSTVADPSNTAVVVLIDSAVSLAEWSNVSKYISILLARLVESSTSSNFLVALVLYGLTDTRPSPILTKRFFAGCEAMKHELSTNPSRLGIGQSLCGDGGGLAVLDGLAASIELFDCLKDLHDKGNARQRHLIHVAASDPDDAINPSFNNTYQLDDLTWANLPMELSSRKIEWSLLCLNPTPRLLKTQQPSARPQALWFPILPGHHLSLAHFPSSRTPPKQATEVGPAPDAKRPRVVAPTAPAPNAAPVHVPESAPSTSAAAPSAAGKIPRSLLMNPEQVHKLKEFVANKLSQAKDLKSRGQWEEANKIEAEVSKQLVMLQELKRHIMAQAQGVIPAQSVRPFVQPASGIPTQLPPAPAVKPHAVPTMTAPMQAQLDALRATTGISKNAFPQGQNAPTQVWHGVIISSITPGLEYRIEVQISSTQNNMLPASDWPSTIQLLPSPFPAVAPDVLRTWITKHEPIICFVREEERPTNPTDNRAKLGRLFQELQSQQKYGLATWAGPAPKLLIMSFSQRLMAAYFPHGIKDIPRAA